MVKRQDQGNAGRCKNQGENGCGQKASKIGPSTAYACCRERLSPFGGLLGLVKFLDLVEFKEIFEGFYKPPERMPEMGHLPNNDFFRYLFPRKFCFEMSGSGEY